MKILIQPNSVIIGISPPEATPNVLPLFFDSVLLMWNFPF